MTEMTDRGYKELKEVPDTEIERLVQAGLPLCIPWHPKQFIPLGATFHSDNLKDPWSKLSPFSLESPTSTPMLVSRDYGTQGVFKSQETTTNSETNDHLELGFGMGAGPPFVASVSVKGDYCEKVKKNNDSTKTSTNFSIRAGEIFFESQPKLSVQGIIAIKYDGGLPAFHKKYGDYYVSAYRLGGDAGIMLSTNSSSKSEVDTYSVTLTLEVLIWSTSETWTKDVYSSCENKDISILGYDTLDQVSYDTAASNEEDSVNEALAQAEEYCDKAKSLDERVSDMLDELGIEDGETVTLAQCRELIEAGVVIELVLLPVTSLREVIHWMREDNVI